MAFNPSPEVAVARDAAAKLKAVQAVVVYVTENGQLGMASYGKDKALCKEAGRLGGQLFEYAMDILAER